MENVIKFFIIKTVYNIYVGFGLVFICLNEHIKNILRNFKIYL